MTTLPKSAHRGALTAGQQREANRFTAASAALRRSKMWLALLLGILFWFSVPYSLPRHQPNANATVQEADNSEQFQGAISRQLAVPALALCACFMLWRYPVRGVPGGRLLILICVYVVWALSSTAWSEDPSLTAKRLAVFAMDCFVTYALARTLSTMEMALGATIAMFVTGVFSVLADIFLIHSFNPADADYRLQGVMTPNQQAMNLVACALCCAALMLRRPRWVPWLSVILLSTLAMLWITRARIGTILCIVLLAIALNKLLRDRVRPHVRVGILLVLLSIVVPLLVFVVGNSGGDAAQTAFMMGRHDTENTSNLSNRLPLWQELLDSVEERPVLGYGYGAFWTEQRAARISHDQGWPVPHAHNTYLDQVIILGVVGGALYLAIMVSALVVAWRRYLHLRSSSNLLNAMLLTWLVLLSSSESAPLDPHMPTMLVYIAVFRMCLREGSVDMADPEPDRPIVEGIDAATFTVTQPAPAVSPVARAGHGTGEHKVFPSRHASLLAAQRRPS
ncbi:O-antigen ligase family protein [Terriglobus aquaticus]|uniref:O-antigen ligase family protein n=1 Tax=Terriglobus aquaticus TaxID=940139 RepID=A0ABW9KG86_9BACT|nr:O-antigen ligase [Terriglobus aquaticus]